MSHVQSMSLDEQNPPKQEENDQNLSPEAPGGGCADVYLEQEAAEEDRSGHAAECENQTVMETEGQEDGMPDAAKEKADAHGGSSHTGKEQNYKQEYNHFLEGLAAENNPESKAKMVIEFMEGSLSKHGSPYFKGFWDARTVLLGLLKENLNPVLRGELWAKYTELSKEARRLKDLLDEQSAFAAEQIEIAVHALEQELQNTQDMEWKVQLPDFTSGSVTLSVHKEFYYTKQRDLNILNAQAARINALRKELIRTEMRIRQKNKFFQRLSAAGDHVFPKRKELIKEISQQFMEDVDAFVANGFNQGSLHESLFELREEIKALQGAAKVITLNTHCFTHTRTRLSECWDQIKTLEKERKKVRAQQKAVHKQNAQQIQTKLQEVNEAIRSNQMPHAEAQRKLDEIVAEIRHLDLEREDVRLLKEELHEAKKPILEKIKADELERLNQSQERERQKKQKAQELKQEIESFVAAVESEDAETVASKKEEFSRKIIALPLSKSEKLDLERLLKPLKDVIAEKKEKVLMALSDDDRQAIHQLKEVLKQRRERRQEIKDQIELFRKASGGSGHDFAQAMEYNMQLAEEKERLEKINEGIKEIEEKISEMEG